MTVRIFCDYGKWYRNRHGIIGEIFKLYNFPNQRKMEKT